MSNCYNNRNQGEYEVMIGSNIEIYQEIDKWKTHYQLSQEEIEALYLNDGVTAKSLEQQLEELESQLKKLTPSSDVKLLQSVFHLTLFEDNVEERQKLQAKIDEIKQKLSNPETFLVYATSQKKPRLRTYPTSDTEEKVFQANLYLARKFAMIYFYKGNREYEYDDLFQEASEALLSASHYYVPLGEATFKSYATKCIENRLKKIIFPKKKKRKYQTSEEFWQQESDRLERLYLYIKSRYILKNNHFYVNHHSNAWLVAARKWNKEIKEFNRLVLNLGEEKRLQSKVKVGKQESYKEFLEGLIHLVKETNLNGLIDEDDRKTVSSLQNFRQIKPKDQEVYTIVEYVYIAKKKIEDIRLYLKVEQELYNQEITPTIELIEKQMNEQIKTLNSTIRYYQKAPAIERMNTNIVDRTWYSYEYFEEYKVNIFNPDDREREIQEITTSLIENEELMEEELLNRVQQELKKRKQKVSQIVTEKNKKIVEENKNKLSSWQAIQKKGKYYRKYTRQDIEKIEALIHKQENDLEEWVSSPLQEQKTPSLSLEDEVIQKLFLEDYYQCLEELPIQEKEILKRWFNCLGKHEMNAKEIAQELNISPRIVYQRKDQALNRLAKTKKLIAYQENN